MTTRALSDDPEVMTTPWGKRRGWEIQRVLISGRVYWRKSWRGGGCCPASTEEVAMWRVLPREQTTPKRSTR